MRAPSSLALAAAVLLLTHSALAREIHVAKSGNNSASGNVAQPYQTISKAAQEAQPGDTVIIHEGVYRESIQPPRGGSGPDKRITYRAESDARVIIKGSERIQSWKPVNGGIWTVTIENSFFGDYNPYALQVSGGWLNYGQWHHRGDVYLNDKAFLEQQTLDALRQTEGSWYCETGDLTTTLWGNFGVSDPNSESTEINVRESLFMPAITGLNYITLDGLHFAHAAPNWAPPVIPLQTGAVGTRMGKGWIIQNCTVSHSRCVGIILGQAPGAKYEDIDSYGDHVVRNNHIRHCGQAGIAGQKGATRCLIEGNLIEETNYRKEFGGWETAAIKFHNSIDTVIQRNLIRGVYHQMQGAFGIWMDFGNQGTRLSGNIIANTQAAAIFLEMNHGPCLVDNNIVFGGGFRSNSENTVLAHNLFVDFACNYNNDIKRRSQYFTPHTTEVAGRKTGVPANDHWRNNVFVRVGLDNVPTRSGFTANHNAYVEGARPSQFGDKQSLATPFALSPTMEHQPLGATIRFQTNESLRQMSPPTISAADFGTFPVVGQRLEDRHGNPLTVDRDALWQPRTRGTVGPLAKMQPGENQVQWTLQRDGKSP